MGKKLPAGYARQTAIDVLFQILLPSEPNLLLKPIR